MYLYFVTRASPKLHLTPSYNHFHNILELFDVLSNFLFPSQDTIRALLINMVNKSC